MSSEKEKFVEIWLGFIFYPLLPKPIFLPFMPISSPVFNFKKFALCFAKITKEARHTVRQEIGGYSPEIIINAGKATVCITVATTI